MCFGYSTNPQFHSGTSLLTGPYLPRRTEGAGQKSCGVEFVDNRNDEDNPCHETPVRLMSNCLTVPYEQVVGPDSLVRSDTPPLSKARCDTSLVVSASHLDRHPRAFTSNR